MIQQLQDKWHCGKCSSNGYCYKWNNSRTGKPECFPLMQNHLNIWADMIIAKSATECAPPFQCHEFQKPVPSETSTKSESCGQLSSPTIVPVTPQSTFMVQQNILSFKVPVHWIGLRRGSQSHLFVGLVHLNTTIADCGRS